MTRALGLLIVGIMLLSCSRGGSSGPEVVLYSSVDDHLLREVVAAFEKDSGVRVRLVGDTEATKTTGLVERLLAERERPRADVWWSSEPFGSVRLAAEGVLERSSAAGREPAAFHSFAARARVIAYNPRRVPEPPRSLAELTDPGWRGRIGMARPQFGTTRGHMGLLLLDCGAERYRAWAGSMKNAGVRVYDGNASVVRGIAQGEIDVGLTDTDDVWSAQRNGWPVELAYAGSACPVEGDGPLLIPNTVGLVRGRPNPQSAQRLLDYLLSAQVERMMAQSDSRNIPLTTDLSGEFRHLMPQGARRPDYTAVAEQIPRALEIWDEVMGR